jgi:F0F1-type ATP synthase membrane subunit b/b'
MNLATAEALSTLLNFSVVVFILWYAGRKPIAEFFAGRSKEISSSVNEARALSSQAQNLLQEWDGKNRSAASEIARQKEDAALSVSKLKEATALRVKSESKRIAEETKLVALAEQAKAKRSLQRGLVKESVEQARKYLESHVENKDSTKLLTDYLERVANGHVG